jgi:hypothetical protein
LIHMNHAPNKNPFDSQNKNISQSTSMRQ